MIPGRVVMSLEIRDLETAKITQVFDAVEAAAAQIAEERDTPIRFEPTGVASVPAPTDERMRRIIAAAADGLNLSYKVMPNGAGHDAQDMTHIAPTGMISYRAATASAIHRRNIRRRKIWPTVRRSC